MAARDRVHALAEALREEERVVEEIAVLQLYLRFLWASPTTYLIDVSRIPLPREIAEEISSYNYDPSFRMLAMSI